MSDFSRYSRQVVLREVGVNGQQLLLDSSVLVIGLGGLGSAASLYLAGAGVGRLMLADRDRVDLSNLQRQIAYAQSDVGRPKTEATASRLQAFNREIEIETFEGPLNGDKLATLLRQADVVLDCTDNFPTRFAINAAAVRAGKPLVSGAAIRFEGQLAVFDPRRADSPCYACLFTEDGEEGERCEEGGILGPVVGTIGTMQALAAIKLLLGLGDDSGRLHVWNAMSLEWKHWRVPKDPACAVCGKRHD